MTGATTIEARAAQNLSAFNLDFIGWVCLIILG